MQHVCDPKTQLATPIVTTIMIRKSNLLTARLEKVYFRFLLGVCGFPKFILTKLVKSSLSHTLTQEERCWKAVTTIGDNVGESLRSSVLKIRTVKYRDGWRSILGEDEPRTGL